MTTRFLTLAAALMLALASSVRAQGITAAAIDAVVVDAQTLVTQRQEAILDEFLAYVERDAGPRELRRLAKSMDKGAKMTFDNYERQVKFLAETVSLTIRRSGGSASDMADLRATRNGALRDLKDMEADLRQYIKDTLEDALNGTLTPPDDGGGGGGGPGDPGPGDPGPGPGGS